MAKLPGWHYDEMKPVGVDYSDISEVSAYDQRMGRLRQVKLESEEIIRLLGLTPHSTVLEFGAGTGAFAVEAARHCARVIAVDVSPAMLQYARQKALQEGIANIEFHHGGFLTFQYSGEPLDAVVTQLALHHLPDFWKLVALRRINALLKNDGRFYLRDIVFSFNLDHYPEFFNKWIESIRLAAGEEVAQDAENSIREEYYTLDWIMEGLLTRAGFKIIKTEYIEGFMGVYLCQKSQPGP